jgi:hypothetical protein
MTYDIYAAPKLPSSLRPTTTESELSFVLPVPRRNHIINPSFEIDPIGETAPYNYESGTYNSATNSFSTYKSMGSVTSENVYNGFRAMRMVMTDTTSTFVYGRTQPVVAPKDMLKNQYIFNNKVYYFVQGALSFYTFVPAIPKYTPFSKFDQNAESTHLIDVNVYATVDANVYPNGSFDNQTTIATSSLNLKISDATFFSEDIEPNVIGRRKNPFWTRHVIPFYVRFDETIPTYIRFGIKNNAAETNMNFVFYLDAVQLEFYDDDYRIHTTYLDGDFGINDALPSDGYRWEGAPKKSTSFRSVEAHSGGVLYNFQTDFDMTELNTQGLGLPAPENQIVPFVNSDGQQYVSTGIDSRKISFDGYILGDTLLDTIRKTGQLQFFLSKARTGIGSKRRFYYRTPIGCDSYSDYTYFDAIVDQITVDHLHQNPITTLGFELHNIDVYFWGDNYVFETPNVLKRAKNLAGFSIVLFKAQGGNPNTDYRTKINKYDVAQIDSFFGYESYDLKVNGPVHCWLELDTGQILFGGDFTWVSYSINGIRTSFTALHIALLNPDGTVLPIRANALQGNTTQYNFYNGVTGPGATVRCMVQTPDRSILVGGRFNKVLNRTNDCKNIWHIPVLNILGQVVGQNRDVDDGLTAPNPTKSKISPTVVYTMLYDRKTNVVYVGGYFTQSATGSINLRHTAVFSIDKPRKWSALGFGVNNAVRTMSFFTEDKVFIGGDFTAAYNTAGTSANLKTHTAYGALAEIDKLTNPIQVIKPLMMGAINNAVVSSLPAVNGAFDNIVKTSVATNSGKIIIGGNFSYVTYNNITLNPTSFVNRYAYPKVVQFDGYKRFVGMETGVSNNTALLVNYSNPGVNHVCKSPYNDDVYAVGRFNQIGSLNQCICIARWTKNRWEMVDFELQISEAYSVFISKRGYGFVSVRTQTTTAGNRDKMIEPVPITIDNVGLNTQFCLELTNPVSNFNPAKILSIYNVTTDKSITFNMSIFVGETVTLDFTRDNIRATSNIRDRVSNSIVGGGTLVSFFLTEGKNVIKILGGQRSQNGRFVRPVQAKIKYHVRQVTPYQLFESDTITVDESMVAWELGNSRLGLDTILAGNLQTQYPSYSWATGAFRLDVAHLGEDTVTIT